ncbi:MAG: ABC transporter ATP-binding protein [Planctomycetota bacterium]
MTVQLQTQPTDDHPQVEGVPPGGSAKVSSDDLCIDLHDVTKVYGRRVKALDGITMQVGHGEIFGLLGPNGAGKSTLVKIMTTIVHPSNAEGSVLGKPLGHKPTLARVGYLPEDHRFPLYLNGRQVLHYYASLAGVSGTRERRKRADRLLDLVGMTRWAKRPIREYSKGMMQRIGLAQALMGDPDLVLLDEPTDGVDPVGRREIREMLRQIRDEGRTIFLNSHLLSEVEMICSRVAILIKGTVRSIGSIEDLTKDSRRIEIEIGRSDAPAWLESAFPHVITASAAMRHAPPIARADGAGANRPNGGATPHSKLPKEPLAGLREAPVVLSWSGAEVDDVQPLIDRLRSEGISIRRVQRVTDSLEDLFVNMVSDDEPGAIDVKRGRSQPATTAPPTVAATA